MKPHTKKILLFLLSALALLVASQLFNNVALFHSSLQKQAEQFQIKLNEKETLLENKSDEFVKQTQHSNDYNNFTALGLNELYANEGILFLIYENDKLKFLSLIHI